MNKYIDFHFYSKILAIIVVLIASVFLIQKSDNSQAGIHDFKNIEIGGWAWNDSVGWISLNCKNDFDGDGLLEDTCGTYSYGLEVSTAGNVVGCAWGGTSRNSNASNTIGYICFSDPGTTKAPIYGTYIANETGWCVSATSTCNTDADCNVANDDRWYCDQSSGPPYYCHVECTADNAASVCAAGSCNETSATNFLCPGGYLIWSAGLNNCYYPSSTVPSILDFESYGGYENNLYFPLKNLKSASTGWWYGQDTFDLDNPQYYSELGPWGNAYPYNNPINGCFNCYERLEGSCLYSTGWNCWEGDGGICEGLTIPAVSNTCDDSGGVKTCKYGGQECLVNDDCGAIGAGEQYCVYDTLEYRCENCLEYFYYDQYNATTSRADQCSLSQAPCEYVETQYPNSGYKFMREIEIGGNTTRTEDLVNFPLLINTTQSYLRHTSKGGFVENINGYDIIFATTSDGTNPLPHELEYYNHRNGKVVAWVSIPLLNGTNNTYINMFYGNSGVTTSTEDLPNLWSEYAFVSHMNDYSVFEVYESVSSTLKGRKAGFNSPTMTTFDYLLGPGQDFDGVDDYIDFDDIANVTAPVTLSVWSNISAEDTGQQPYNFITTDDVASTSPNTAKTGFWLRILNQLEIGFGDGSNILTRSSNPVLTAGEKYFVGVVSSTDSAGLSLYVNGEKVDNANTTVAGSASSVWHNTSTLRVGRREGWGTTEADYNTTGAIDEARIATVARSADWIAAEYDNQNSAGWISIGCRQRYSSSTNGDQMCTCSNNPGDYENGYPDFPCNLFTQTECDVCEKHEVNDLFKTLGGYDCYNCTVEDFENRCTDNALGTNRNRCEYCEEVYATPGVIYDSKRNTIQDSSTSGCNPLQLDPSADDYCQRGALCGWGINSWTSGDIANFGLGWFQFSPRITSSSRPYFSVESGNIYSKGNIYSRYSPPFGKYNASYLIESGGEITNFISSSTISEIYEGELSNRPTIDFFEILELNNSKKYRSSLGLIDYTGMVTDVDTGLAFNAADGVNKYGSTIDYVSSLPPALSADGGVLNGKTYTVNTSTFSNITFDNTTSTMIAIDRNVSDGLNSSGIIVIDGDLIIQRNIFYEDSKIPSTKTDITTRSQIPSLVWIVRGDVTIDPSVTELAGTFIVLGAEGVSCPDSRCGIFDTGAGGNQLVVEGSVLARQFVLGRTYSDSSGEPSEKFINTGRLQANPPIGLQDLKKLTPNYNF